MNREAVRDLMRRENVVAVGEGYKNDTDQPAIVVGVKTKLPLAALDPQEVVPLSYDGVPTDVIEAGIIRALSTNRERPALGGDSIGHVDITAGTLGCVLRRNGKRVILSNNHVLANSNAAAIGDPILQPGRHDGGTAPADIIAQLTDFVEIGFVGVDPSDCPIGSWFARVLNWGAQLLGRQTRLEAVRPREIINLVDAAIATPISDEVVLDGIRELGFITGVQSAELGMPIVKRGRTTNTTFGTVNQINATVQVQYGAGQVAIFEDQLMAGNMSQGGDSGSAVLSDPDHRLVGLLYAGSDTVTIINRIENVMQLLDLTL